MKGYSTMLLKTHVEKMTDNCLSTMLMKTHKLNPSFHDINDKKGSYGCRG
jgi:hypothetical protein